MTKKLLATTSLLAAGFLSQNVYAINDGDDKEQTAAIAAKAPADAPENIPAVIPAAAPAPVEASFFGRLFGFSPKLPPAVTPADLKEPVALPEAAPAPAPAPAPAAVEVQADPQKVEEIQQNLAQAVQQLEENAAQAQQSQEVVLTAEQAQAMDLARSLTLDTVKQIEEAKSPEEQQQIIQQAVLSASKMPGLPVEAPTKEQWTWFGVIAKIMTLGLYNGSSAAPVVEAAAPVVEAAAPVVEAAAPVVEAAAPVVEAAAPVVEAAAPVVEAAAPVVEAAAPVVKAAAPVVEAPAPAPAVDAEMAETILLSPLDRVFAHEDIQTSVAKFNCLLDEDLTKSELFEIPSSDGRQNRKQTLKATKKSALRTIVNDLNNKKVPLANWKNGEALHYYLHSMLTGDRNTQGFSQLNRLLAKGTPISEWHAPAIQFLVKQVLPKDQAKRLQDVLDAEEALKKVALSQ